jgi:Ca2+/H+ antiporter, TMEM165/GDT1 family
MAALFLMAYVAVFLAELVGDKLIYSIGALATQYGPRIVMYGLLPALALKSLAAVVLGDAVARLPRALVAASSAAAFFAAAVAVWRESATVPATARPSLIPSATPVIARRGMFAAFATVFFAEWADPGQLAAAGLTARYGSPLVIWVAAVSAMATKAGLALTLGITLRRYVPRRTLRVGAVALSVALGIAAVASIAA